MKITSTVWDGMNAVLLSNAGYEALILPDMGANCIALRRPGEGLSFLRTPESAEIFTGGGANVYGLPLLFPPNRIRDGHYTFEGRSYDFPINEPARRHHIHGFLSETPFTHEGGGVFSYEAAAEKPYLTFPHAFRAERAYALDEDGLRMTLRVENKSAENMPCGVGIHAAWNTCFGEGDTDEAALLQLPVISRWAVDERIIPTLETETDTDALHALRQGSMHAAGTPLSMLMEKQEGAVYRLSNNSGTFCCDPGDMRFIMLWNKDGKSGFVCPEPQNWLVDAPNLELEPEKSGFMWLQVGEVREWEIRWWFEGKRE